MPTSDKYDAPDSKWESQLRKGSLELAVLASLGGSSKYGLEIIRALETNSFLVLSEGTIYPILNRLRQDGLVTSKWVEADTGHPRKYYALTPAGRKRAAAMAQTWREFASSLNGLVEPLLNGKDGSAGHD